MSSTLDLINAAINCALDWMGDGDNRQILAESLYGACQLGNLRLVTFIAEGLRFTSDEVEVIRQALKNACEFENLDVAMWLKNTYSLTAADARKVLERCCNSRGVKCLVEAFGLTADDAREALKNACESENIDVVWGLLSYMEFPEDAIRKARALVDGNKEIVDTLDGFLSGKPSY